MNPRLVRLAVGLLALAGAASVRGDEPVPADSESLSPTVRWLESEHSRQTARQNQELYRLRLAIPSANPTGPGPVEEAAPPESLPPDSSASAPPPVSRASRVPQILLAAVGLLAGIGAVRWFGTRLPPASEAGGDSACSRSFPADRSVRVCAHEKGFSKLGPALAGCRVEQQTDKTPPSRLLPPMPAADLTASPAHTGAELREAFFDRAPEPIANFRRWLWEIQGAPDLAARRELLRGLGGQFGTFKEQAGQSRLFPIWQVASAVEGLLRQLANQPNGATPVLLRTAAGAVDLLDDLCRTKLKPETYAGAPLRFLAVDDDPISLRIISRALRRTLKEPDLADDAPAALGLAKLRGYDVIFLDVQMPVMDGFDLCAKIHQTAPNRTTPIVFITCHSNLPTRARSSLCGGLDLIGKPFLTSEVTLKALIFALRHRLATRGLVEA